MHLGEKLASLRKKRGMTQEDLAEKLDVTRKTISKWELNQSAPDLSYLIQLSDIYGVTTDFLLREEKQKEKGEQSLGEGEKEENGSRDNRSEIARGTILSAVGTPVLFMTAILLARLVNGGLLIFFTLDQLAEIFFISALTAAVCIIQVKLLYGEKEYRRPYLAPALYVLPGTVGTRWIHIGMCGLLGLYGGDENWNIIGMDTHMAYYGWREVLSDYLPYLIVSFAPLLMTIFVRIKRRK